MGTCAFRGGLRISHLLFIDDVMFFIYAIVSHARVIRHTLFEFCGASGMMVNSPKSKVFNPEHISSGGKNKTRLLLDMSFAYDLATYFEGGAA